MTSRKIEKLAEQVLRELRSEGRIFATDHVLKSAGVWAIAFSHGKSLVEVSIDVQTHNTEKAIKEEIRRQLVEASERHEKPSPAKRSA